MAKSGQGAVQVAVQSRWRSLAKVLCRVLCRVGGEVWQRCCAGCCAESVAKSGKGAVQAAVQGALQGAVHYLRWPRVPLFCDKFARHTKCVSETFSICGLCWCDLSFEDFEESWSLLVWHFMWLPLMEYQGYHTYHIPHTTYNIARIRHILFISWKL